jgi:hypothetical protein
MAEDPILPMILRAQQQNAEHLSAAHLHATAERLVALVRSLDYPLLMPVSRDAERLVGAALLLGGAQLEAATGATMLAGQRVLVVDAVVVQTGSLDEGAFIAQRAGAEVIGGAVLHRIGSGTSQNLPIHEVLVA